MKKFFNKKEVKEFSDFEQQRKSLTKHRAPKGETPDIENDD